MNDDKTEEDDRYVLEDTGESIEDIEHEMEAAADSHEVWGLPRGGR